MTWWIEYLPCKYEDWSRGKVAGRLAEMSALVNKKQLLETLTSAYASPHMLMYLHKCIVHILKLEGAKDRYMELYLRMLLKKSRFSLLKADYIILNAYVHCDPHKTDYDIYI